MIKTSGQFPNLLVVIGASAGGLKPIREIVRLLPMEFQGVILIATHRDPNLPTNSLAELLGQDARLAVREPVEGEQLHCTTLYIGGPAESVQIDGRHVHIDEVSSHLERLQRIDDLFLSAAEHAGTNAVGVILSGTLFDGVSGLRAIHDAGGKCIVQNPRDATFDDMPKNAIDSVEIDFVGNTTEIASLLVELAAGRQCQE
ncbi:MAG: chemotaxis protein CheB [Planctomycetaceae bacterium]|nr:chemotaxis protein CheB [Planctomycetaceae bacterium]